MNIIAAILIVAAAFNGWTEAHTAADTGDAKALTKVLDRSPRLARAGDAGQHTPLHLAAWSGHCNTAEVLLAKGADINAKDVCGWTPLHTAAVQDQKAVAELLLSKGADVNAKDANNQTPLRLAVRFKRTAIADLLRERGGHE